MKKICMITTVSSTLKSFVVDTAKYLHKQCGYDVTLICNTDEKFEKSLPSYVHYIPVPMSRGVNFSGFKSIKLFKEIFKREKFDLVQYATPNASFYASVAAKKAKIPIRLYCQWGIRYVGFQKVKRRIFKFLEKHVCKNSTHIFAVSPLNMQFAIQEKLYPSSKATVVGNGGTIGVPASDYDMAKKQIWRVDTRTQFGIGEKDFVFGFAGRISIDKGCGELLTAFKGIAEKEENTKLFIVGPMEEDCGVDSALLKWTQQSSQVILTGNVKEEDMRKYYAAMDVLVHPTYREGFGMVIQEAGALAIPTITTNIPGASEVMEDGVSCVLIPAKDAAALKEMMESLLCDEERVNTLGQAAYERTMKLYERQIMLANQKACYQKLLEK